MRRHIPWTDYLLVRVACWCRDHMTTATAYYFDLEAHDRMAKVLGTTRFVAVTEEDFGVPEMPDDVILY